MATLTERHNPSFSLWPINNDRTAWRPFGLPVVLVVPHMRDASGLAIANSSVSNVAIVVEGAPNEALVAGHDHIGMRYPDRELFRERLSSQELLDRQINTFVGTFETVDGVLIDDRADVKDGDILVYTTATGVTDKITFYNDADYFDLSDVLVETEQLPPNRYNLIYSCDFYARVVAKEKDLGIEELICIDINQLGQATLRFGLNHPGEVMREFYDRTPPVNLTSNKKSEDSTVAFYRSFTDILQDVYDEQAFVRKINWVNEVPYEAIPYLSQLVGWDVPYFPESLDQLRRLILKKTRELQQLKGSRRAIRELLNLFGFTILFKNVWYATDGSRFIAPGETLPPAYRDQQITYSEVFQVEPVLADYKTNGFGELTVSLIYRPQRLGGTDPFKAPEDSADLTIDAYLVATGGAADVALKAQVALMDLDPEGYGSTASCLQDQDGFINVGQIQSAVANLPIVGHSQILIVDGIGIDQALAGIEPPFKVVGAPLLAGISFNQKENTLRLVFDHHMDFEGNGTTLYAFASYKRQDTIVPAALTDYRSNRFTIQLLSRDGNDIRPDILDFVIDFIHKIKAFHSILDAIQYRVQLTETYLVTDLCVGGNVTQRYDVAIGRQQVPPAIIPNTPTENCQSLTPEGLGYKPADLQYRRSILAAVLEEYNVWRSLDGRESAENVLLQLIAASPFTTGSCQYTPGGQDRVVGDITTITGTRNDPPPNAAQHSGIPHLQPFHTAISGVGVGKTSTDADSSPFSSVNIDKTKPRQSWCELDSQTDYCYKGRVGDELTMRLSPTTVEVYRNRQCGLTLGMGTYWTYPTESVRVIAGVKRPARISKTRKSVYSGGSLDVYERPLNDGPQGGSLTADPRQPLAHKQDSLHGRLLRSYGQPINESIHFSNRDFLGDARQSQWLALQRPSLEIDLQIMHFPGCRFPSLGKLKNDYVSTEYTARPWDDLYSTDEPSCRGTPSFLNARLETGTDGNQILIYDDKPFKVLGNGQDPDISGLGSQNVPTGLVSSDIVHAIYSTGASGGHPAIETDEDDMDDTGTPGDIGTFDFKLFPSAVESGTGGYVDYIDGYPSRTGYFEYDDLDLGNGGLFTELFEALGIPGIEFGGTGGSMSATLLFYLSSGIRTGELGVRLDCGCQVPVENTAHTRLPCASDLYLNQDGQYEFDGDLLTIQRVMLLEERLGVGPYMLDGSIPSLMELVPQ